jgi:hypothetical protein
LKPNAFLLERVNKLCERRKFSCIRHRSSGVAAKLRANSTFSSALRFLTLRSCHKMSRIAFRIGASYGRPHPFGKRDMFRFCSGEKNPYLQMMGSSCDTTGPEWETITAIDHNFGRNDGKHWVPLASDTAPQPSLLTKWKYRAIYRVGDQQVGQWSTEMSITVGG